MSKHTTVRCDVCGGKMTYATNRVELLRADSIGGGAIWLDVVVMPTKGMFYDDAEDICDSCCDAAVKQAARNIDEARARRATRVIA